MHAYDLNGTPHHWVPNKSRPGSNRPTTIRDLQDNRWLPSVTEVLNVLEKPALVRWKVMQGVMAVVTAPDVPGEAIDAKIERVLSQERQQDEESRIARELGTDIHDGLQSLIQGKQAPEELRPWIEPPWFALRENLDNVLACEQVLVGDGYAGRCDLIAEGYGIDLLVDFKTAKKLPDPAKGSWPEHEKQLAAYALAYKRTQIFSKPVRTANLYISTKEAGQFVLIANPNWEEQAQAFMHLLAYWRIENGL